jgi:hypothetical protein
MAACWLRTIGDLRRCTRVAEQIDRESRSLLIRGFHMTSVDELLNADRFAARKRAFGPQTTDKGRLPRWRPRRSLTWRDLSEIAANVAFLAAGKVPTADNPSADGFIGGDSMYRSVPTLSDRGVDAAIAVHADVVHIYEQAWNAHTFDFEKHVGHFAAPDITIVSGGTLGGRSLLRETSDARADYIRGTNATVTINMEITCVADMDTTVVVVAEGDLSFTYTDQTTYTQPMMTSSTLRLVDGAWIFQHIHFGRRCY